MTDFKKFEAFLETTTLHALEGEEFGIHAGDVGLLLLAVGVGICLRERGTDATINLLRKQADKLEHPRG